MKGVVADKQQGKSFIYKMNKSDPSMLPCGTPDITGSNCDIDWLIFYTLISAKEVRFKPLP